MCFFHTFVKSDYVINIAVISEISRIVFLFLEKYTLAFVFAIAWWSHYQLTFPQLISLLWIGFRFPVILVVV